MKNGMKYVVITPVRDEARHIEQTLSSMTRQTTVPVEWIIVDDGSTDGTSEILDRWSAENPFIKVIHNTNRGYRASGSGVMEAFYIGYDRIASPDWGFLVKLDGDLLFQPDYFEKCIARFDADPKIGIGGGIVCIPKNGTVEVEEPGEPPFHVRGATKIYRRECWDMIHPLIKAPGWDTIDEVKANYHGWKTKTFSDINLIQLKPTGTADGKWKDFYKNGVSDYICGYHPLFMMAKCLKRIRQRPFFVSAVGHWVGYVSAYAKNVPRDPDEKVRRYLQRQQIRRMMMQSSIYGQ
jgi:poly-beta-1,6-N-acetyl-D-glucosamine synthase